MCKILVVDDYPDIRTTLHGILSDAGYDVETARNEGETFQKVTQEKFDFALIDVRLHGEDEKDESGISLAIALGTFAPGIRIILLSRYTKIDQIVRAIRFHGVVDYVDKSTQSWTDDILTALEDAKSEMNKVGGNNLRATTRLHLSLEKNRSIIIRTFGERVYFTRSMGNLDINLEGYSRRADLAIRDYENWRFETQDIGKSLWHDIFDNIYPLGNVYSATKEKSDVLSIVFEARDEFLKVPLEFLFANSDYLALQHPITRFVSNVVPKQAPISSDLLATIRKVHVLLIASNTEPSIDGVDREVEELKRFLETQNFVKVTFIPTEKATYNRIKKEITNSNYDIIHYAGHGKFEKSSPEQSKLYFWPKEHKQGTIKPMLASELRYLLENSGTRLLYLSACYGTATADETALLDDNFLGLADAAVKAGVPSVIGYRWPVSDNGAKNLAIKFYESLLEQGSPQIALLNARRDVAGPSRDDPAWLSPIMIHQA